MTLFKEAADIKTADQLNLPTPTPVCHNVVAQPTEIKKAWFRNCRSAQQQSTPELWTPFIDNMLRSSMEEQLGLDQRVINPDLHDEPGSKVNQCVDNIYRIWDEGQQKKLTQLVFCDLSTPKAEPSQRAAKASAGNLDSPELHALETVLEKGDMDASSNFTIYDDIGKSSSAKRITRPDGVYP